VNARNTWLTIFGVAGLCMALAPNAIEAKHAEPIPPDSAKGRRDHFHTSTEAVVAFLEAVKAKNAVRLRKATSVHAPNEAMPENRFLFRAILEQNLSGAELTALASELEGFQAVRPLRGSAGRTTYLVLKPSPNGRQFVRIFSVRWEKKTGWKVRDIGERRQLEKPVQGPPKRIE